MTQEEQILLVDLYARLPYGVICKSNSYNNILFNSSHISLIESEGIKPYLRPIDFMTEEEKEELKKLSDEYLEEWTNTKTSIDKWKLDAKISYNRSKFYNSHYLDWNGLIPMRLAFEAPEGMYKIE